MIISKEDFVKTIKAIDNIHQMGQELQDVCDKYNADMQIYCFPSLEDELVNTLIAMFDDKADDIAYFIYEIDFGRDFTMGDVRQTLPDGSTIDIDFSSAEKLYDYLTRQK